MKERIPYEKRGHSRLMAIHRSLADVRHELESISRDNESGVCKDRTEYISGGITCAMVAVHHQADEALKSQILWDDREYGEHLKFSSRGIGSEWLGSCFVCGPSDTPNGLCPNIAAFVASKEDGGRIVGEFFEGNAKLDFRPSEPNWIQVKVGCCDKHLCCLQFLDKRTRQQGGVIRSSDVKDAISISSL